MRNDNSATLYSVKGKEGERVLIGEVNGRCNMRLKNNECRCTCKENDLTKII
ncbi:hypothetical protein BMS3Abin15_00265 [bacterium BMS3Abin15]|nr:hypothetical protein BMS3Abin15_00265 [bacterium BMS3Abin15]